MAEQNPATDSAWVDGLLEQTRTESGIDLPKLIALLKQAEIDERPGYTRQFTEKDWQRAYEWRAFPGVFGWRMRQIWNGLKRQYAAKRSRTNYWILTWRAASLATRIAMMEVAYSTDARQEATAYLDQLRVPADHPLRELLVPPIEQGQRFMLGSERMLKEYIAQLQKYTETEKFQINLETSIVENVMDKMLPIIERTVTDPATLVALLRAIDAALAQDAFPRDVPQIPAPDEEPIDGDYVETVAG